MQLLPRRLLQIHMQQELPPFLRLIMLITLLICSTLPRRKISHQVQHRQQLQCRAHKSEAIRWCFWQQEWPWHAASQEAQPEGRSIQQLRGQLQLQAMGCRAAVREVLRAACSRGREAQDLTAARAATVRRGIPRTAQVHRAVQTQAHRGIQLPMGHRV